MLFLNKKTTTDSSKYIFEIEAKSGCNKPQQESCYNSSKYIFGVHIFSSNTSSLFGCAIKKLCSAPRLWKEFFHLENNSHETTFPEPAKVKFKKIVVVAAASRAHLYCQHKENGCLLVAEQSPSLHLHVIWPWQIK